MNVEVKNALAELVAGASANGTKIRTLEENLANCQGGILAMKDQLMSMQQKGVKLDMSALGQSSRSLGRAVAEADGLKAIRDRQSRHMRVEVKNTILGESGSPQSPDNTFGTLQNHVGIVSGAFRALSLLDIIPRGQAAGNQIHFTREASWTNAAAETAEAGSKPESTLTMEGIDSPVRTIAHWIRTSVQVLEDAPALQSYIDMRMRHGVEQRLEAQLIAGDGTGSNLSGLTATGNHTDLTVVTADTDLDAANRAKVQVITADFRPSVYVINPADWGRIERTKTGISSDKSYLAASGNAVAYIENGMQPLLWGLPVVLSNSMTAGQFLCMARDATMLWDRQTAAVELFAQDGDNVTQNLVTIRAEGRWAFGVFAPAAVVHGAWPDAA
ncbi:MAG: phage major capsid protein [Roseovarius sp.]|nr:phage major capsid protein [Roseovarius sp.]